MFFLFFLGEILEEDSQFQTFVSLLGIIIKNISSSTSHKNLIQYFFLLSYENTFRALCVDYFFNRAKEGNREGYIERE